MVKIEFSSAAAPFRRIGDIAPAELAAKLSDGELAGETRSHHPGATDRLQMFEVRAPAGTVYAFRAGPEGVPFFNFRPRLDVTYRTPAEIREQRS